MGSNLFSDLWHSCQQLLDGCRIKGEMAAKGTVDKGAVQCGDPIANARERPDQETGVGLATVPDSGAKEAGAEEYRSRPGSGR